MILGGKEVPPAMYTSKILQQGGVLTSRTVHLHRTDLAKNDGGKQDNAEEKADAPHEEDRGMHLPSGQHLLVDINTWITTSSTPRKGWPWPCSNWSMSPN
jgi:hypothetical protein